MMTSTIFFSLFFRLYRYRRGCVIATFISHQIDNMKRKVNNDRRIVIYEPLLFGSLPEAYSALTKYEYKRQRIAGFHCLSMQ